MVTVRVNRGRVEEFENGSMRRTFGSKIVFAATDGESVVAVTSAGRVERWAYRQSRPWLGGEELEDLDGCIHGSQPESKW